MTRLCFLLGALAACSVPSKLPSFGDEGGTDAGATSMGSDSGSDGTDPGGGAGAGDDAGTDAPAPIALRHCDGSPNQPRVFVYTRTTGEVHDALSDAEDALFGMCSSEGFSVTISADPRALDAARLASTDVLVVALASGSVFDAGQRTAVEAWARAGGGVVGLHTATAIDGDWGFWKQLVGATMATHPPTTSQAKLETQAFFHPIVSGLPWRWELDDEWYTFANRPEDNGGMTMLLALDEDSVKGRYENMYQVDYHPLVWCHELYGGRVVQSAIGHSKQLYRDSTYLGFVSRSIRWAAHRL